MQTPPELQNLMVDLETMGANPKAPIVAIGAVFFDLATGNTGPSFYTAINITSEMDLGATPDGETILWWLKQSQQARAAITDDNALSITEGLSAFNAFVASSGCDTKTLKVWGNGAPFDNVILRSAFSRASIPEFWRWSNDRDVRTIVDLGKAVGFDPKKDYPFAGERHHALADAIHQVGYVSAIYRKLIPAQKPELALNFSVQQLCDLCDFIGIQYIKPEADALEAKVWIGDGTIAGENGEPDYHGLIAHDAEYPEEGAIALEEQPRD